MCEEDEEENEEAAYEWIAVGEEDDTEPEPPVQQRKRHREARSPGLPVVTSASSLVSPHEGVEVELHEEESVIKRTRVIDHEDHEDEDTLFCKSVAHTLRRLAPRRKALAKLRVLQALYDAEFGSDVGPDVEVRLKTADV